MSLSKPKKPKKTAEELATEKRQRSLLDKRIEDTEGKFSALTRGKLGRESLLSGASRSLSELAGKNRRGGRGGAGSLLGGRGGRGGSAGGGTGTRTIRSTRNNGLRRIA